MPDLLPDVAQSDWNGYQADQFTADTNQRISSLAPPSSDSLTNPLGTGNAPPPPQSPAEPPPPPEPQLPDVTTENFGGAAATPTRAPIAVPDSVAFPSPAPASSVVPSASPGRGVSGPSDLIAAALNAADEAGVDPNLFVALVNQESSFNPTARSPVGAMGLTQLMPDTARGLGVSDPFDVQQSLMGGAKYLRQMLDRNGGDAVKALAAYNAGQGNLDRYGITGVLDPSFAHGETLKYVDNIMSSVAANQGGVGVATNTPSGGPQLVPDATRPAGTPGKDISQFGDPQLTAQEAYAACGPAAAVRFAERFGRNPTLREATDLAKSVGWTPQQGMAGLGSEKALMDKLPDPVPTKLVNGADWRTFANEAQTGNPVIISTAGHYFYADGYNPDTGAFHVGRSGLDLKSGAEWMTPAQMTNLMGPVQGGLLADNPQVPQPSTADQQSNPIDWLGKQKDALASGIGNAVQGATSAASSLFPQGDVTSAMPASMQPMPSDSLTNPLGTGNAPQPPPPPPAGPLDVVKQKFSDALDALGGIIGGATTAAASSTNPQVTTPTLPSVSVSNQPDALAGNTMPSATGEPASLQVSPADVAATRQSISDVASGKYSVLSNAQTLTELADKYPSNVPGLPDVNAMTSEDRQRYNDATIAIGALSSPLEVGSTRMFHGTGSDFARPEPGQFDSNGLFGPGYYLTSSPEVAGGIVGQGVSDAEQILQDLIARRNAPGISERLGSIFDRDIAKLQNQVALEKSGPKVLNEGYAQARGSTFAELYQPRIDDLTKQIAEYERIKNLPQYRDNPETAAAMDKLIVPLREKLSGLEAFAPDAGPNVRAVDVPQNLNLLNADAGMPLQQAQNLIAHVASNFDAQGDTAVADTLQAYGAKGIQQDVRTFDNTVDTGRLIQTLYGTAQRVPGSATNEANARVVASALADAGFDGIQYAGGQRIPMQDAAGRNIEHNAVVVFPESLDKLRNAISGTQGGQASVPFATSLGGAAAGGVTAYQTTDPNDPNRALKIAGGALAGGALGYGAGRLAGNPAVQRFVADQSGELRLGGTPPENPFQLHTEAGPNRVPITADEAAAHLEDLHARYQANDGRISELENRLSSGSRSGKGEFSGTVVRPPWAVGWTDDALRQLAHDNNVNPYQGGWWEQANFVPGTGEMRYDVGQSARRGTGQRKLTPTDMRRELGQLRAEQGQIVAAADHAYANSSGQFYRTEVSPAADLPFDYPQASATSTAAEVPGPVATTAPASRGSGYQAQAPESVGAPPEAAARPPLGAGFASGADELAAARQAVADLADRYPRMTPGSLRASGPGKRLAELEVDAAAHPGKYEVRPTLEPEVASTLTPGSGPLAPPAPPQSADATLRGLVNLAKARGIDTSSIEAQLPRVNEPPITADMVTGKAEPPAPTFEQVQQIAQKYVQQSTERKAAVAAGGRPPTEPPLPPAPPGGGGEPPELFTSSGAPVPIKAGITPEMVQVAHQRIDRAIDPGSPRNYDAHQQLEDMLAHGASPDQIARFLFGKVEGQTVTPTSLLRTVRTGSLAGGLTTEGKVLLGPVIQTAMRAPVGVIRALIERHPGNIRSGLQGGIAGLAEGAVDALQTLRYGINYRSALGGTAGGGYGFAPGLDVMGSNALKRAAGTAAMGLVRTHGAIADVSASIGRGAARATGATPERAAEVGQQWALRSGKYGTIGQAVSQRIGDLRNVNPAMDVVGQILLPFYRVGYNALTQGVERSPVGLAGTAADVARGRLPASAPSWLRGPYAAGADSAAVTPVGLRLANNMFGVGLAAYGLFQAAAGNITGDKPPTGDPKWSIRVPETAKLGPLESLARRDRNGNLWLPIRTIGPAGEALAQSAILYESARDGAGNVPEVAARSAAAYVGHVGDESFLNNIANIFGLLDDAKNLYSSSAFVAKRAQNELAYQAGSIGKSFIPQDRLAEQIAAAVGTYTSPSSKAASGSATAVPTEAVAPARTAAPTEAPSRRRYTPPARATSTPRTRP